MYIEKLNNGKYRYQVTFIEERTGKRKKVSVTLPKNTDRAKREAEKLLNEKISAINVSFQENNDTLRVAFDDYLAAKRPEWRPGTYRRNSFAANALCSILDGDTLICRLTARHVSDRFSHSGKTGTALNELQTRLKAFLRWCWDTDRITDIAWIQKLKPYPEPTVREKNKQKYLERDELLTLLPELKIDLNRYIIEFLALSGLRIGEALALTKDDVDDEIHVTKTLDLRTGEICEGAKTDCSMRDVFIQDELRTLCREIRKYMTKMSLQCGFRSDLFFSDFEGKPVSYFRLNKYFAENTERVIGRRLTLHSLRHTHASLMFEGGASLESVSLRLGHSDSRTTKEIYLHITQKLKEKYNQTFDAIRIIQ